MKSNNQKRVIIVGAGPAGLTAALELIRSGAAVPIVLEASGDIGGISRTVNYKGYRMDIGGHRFFSKSDWVMDWWKQILPIQAEGAVHDKVMLIRNRLSRIYFLRKYFDYPIKLNGNTLANLGPVRLVRIGVSYAWATMFPRRNEKSLEDFMVNRFGGELYRTFFKDYTEKVWGVSCKEISSVWGAQRIKGLSIISAIRHALKKKLPADHDANQKETQTSLIERFLYPKLGPGQLWEEVAAQVIAGGGEIHLNHKVDKIVFCDGRVRAVKTTNGSGLSAEHFGDSFISTMPVKDLVLGFEPQPPADVVRIARDLPYRDFITVGLLLSKMKPNEQSHSCGPNNAPPDNWIYIQERDVRIGRLQVFNNWSPHLLSDGDKVWLGLEYFCQEGDDLWQKSDEEMLRFAASELSMIGMINTVDVIDGTVIRVPKTYPAYFGAYSEFGRIREYVDGIPNLFLVGRNGMHRYNNQDHSMLTAKLAADAIVSGVTDKSAIWAVNVDDEYHEEKK